MYLRLFMNVYVSICIRMLLSDIHIYILCVCVYLHMYVCTFFLPNASDKMAVKVAPVAFLFVSKCLYYGWAAGLLGLYASGKLVVCEAIGCQRTDCSLADFPAATVGAFVAVPTTPTTIAKQQMKSFLYN